MSPSTSTGERVLASMIRNSALDRLARLVELQQRNAQTFLLDFGGIDRDAARHDAADIGVMRDGRGKAGEPSLHENRLQDIDVRQMLAAGAIRIVGDQDVARHSASSP